MGEIIYLNEVSKTLGIARASKDPDLIAFYELRHFGSTEAVKESRANLLEVYNEDQLKAEIMADYGLTEHDVLKAIAARVEEINFTLDQQGGYPG